MVYLSVLSGGSRIFPGGEPTPKVGGLTYILAENCMKMKEFGTPRGGARPWRPPLRSATARNLPKLQVHLTSLKADSGKNRLFWNIFGTYFLPSFVPLEHHALLHKSFLRKTSNKGKICFLDSLLST